MLIAVIGGRITPNFTRNWLSRRRGARLPPMAGVIDRVALGLSLLALVSWCAFPQFWASGGLLAVAGVACLGRLSRWRGFDTGGEPLVWILHVGYLWLCAAMLLLGVSVLRPDFVPPTAGMHALTAGAVGVMTLAVMTSASLGHTGRTLAAGRWTVAIYVLVNASAALRIAAAMAPAQMAWLLGGSAALWALAFGLFVAVHAAMLTTPRADSA